MSSRISIILITVLMAACVQEQFPDAIGLEESYLIEASELQSNYSRPNIKVLDFRKKDDYEQGHILGAMNIWRSDIEDDSYDYQGMMASKDQIETLLGKLGVSSKDTIVIYDDNGLCNASRLWWILQNYNFDKVKLLHGGIEAWQRAGGIVTEQKPDPEVALFELSNTPMRKYTLSMEEVHEALSSNAIILDTRTAAEFSGQRQKKGASKAGRIPGSIHIDWAEAIDYDGDGRIRSIEELEQIYSELNVDKDSPIIVYCHSGVRSAHTTFVLTQILGYKNVRNYDGSWTEWSYFDDLPFESDT